MNENINLREDEFLFPKDGNRQEYERIINELKERGIQTIKDLLDYNIEVKNLYMVIY